MSKFVVTLEALRKAGACYIGYNRVVRMLQNRDFTHADVGRKSYIRFSHNQNISLLSILESNGVDDALWTLRCIPDIDRDCRLYAVWCARQSPLIKGHIPSETLIDACEAFANGKITRVEMGAARSTARRAARAAARDVAWDAARSAALDAAQGAALDAARDAAWDANKEMFIRMCSGIAPWQQSDSTDAT